jgi:hypothetical protein
MARARVLSGFLVTLAVLVLVVGFSLRRDTAQAQSPAEPTTTLVEYHPVSTLANQESVTVHVVNVGRDAAAPPENFTITFTDNKGNVLQSETCSVTAGQACSSDFICTITGKGKDGTKGTCVVRATVIGEAMGCVTPDMGTGDWTTNLELLDKHGSSKFIAGAHGDILHLPTAGTCGGGGIDSGSGGSLDTPASGLDTPTSGLDTPISSLDTPVSSLDSPAGH